MGNQCCSLSSSKPSSPSLSTEVEEIQIQFTEALENIRVDLSQGLLRDVKNFIQLGNDNLESDRWVVKKDKKYELKLKKIVIHTSNELKLIVRVTNVSNPEEQIKNMIIYDYGFFVGDIQNDVISGKGTLYFTNADNKYISVEGRWKKGKLQEALIKKLDEIKLKVSVSYRGHQEITLNWYVKVGKDITATIFKRQIIDFSLDDLFNLQALLTVDKAEITFPNGDTYRGRVNKGEMDTDQSNSTDVATYKTFSTGVIYTGHFKKGKREGRGTLQIPIKNKNQHFPFNEQVQLQVMYKQGELQAEETVLKFMRNNDKWGVELKIEK